MSSSNAWHVIGATVLGVIGAASIIIIEHFRQERQRHRMSRDLERMSTQLSGMRAELNQLRELQKNKEKKNKKVGRKRHSSTLSTTTNSTEDYRSAVDIDSSDQEFYDLSDEETLSSAERTLDTIYKEIDNGIESGNEEIIRDTIVVMENLLADDENNTELQWRIASAYYQLSVLTTDHLLKQEYIQKGIEICTQALQTDSNNSNVHKYYAILIGSRAEFQSMKDRIADGHLFKQHIDIAVQLNPRDASLHHLLGRFSYEVANLKWYERTAASALFGEPPSATINEALNHFLTAERLAKKEWKENRMLIAKCFIANGEYKVALQWLLKAKNVLSKGDVEKRLDIEIQALIGKYGHYR